MRIVRMTALGAALMLAGCQTTTETVMEPVSAPPANYRQIAATHIRSVFFDPFSIRDAEIAPPKRGAGPSLNNDGFNTPWVVCVRANAKNRMGGYTGRTITALAISGNSVVNSWDEAHYSRMVCDGAAYEPFPEIEAGGIPKRG